MESCTVSRRCGVQESSGASQNRQATKALRASAKVPGPRPPTMAATMTATKNGGKLTATPVRATAAMRAAIASSTNSSARA